MACSFYSLSVSAGAPSTYTFTDCNGSIITLTGLTDGDEYYFNADPTIVPPPLVTNITIKDSENSERYDFVDCCNQIGGGFYFYTTGLPSSAVSSSSIIYYSNGVVLTPAINENFCMQFGSSISVGFFEFISAIKIYSVLNNSCSNCTEKNPCNQHYFRSCCDGCPELNQPGSNCFLGVLSATKFDENTYPISVNGEFSSVCYTTIINPISSGYNMYDITVYKDNFKVGPSKFGNCEECLVENVCLNLTPTPTPTKKPIPTPTPTKKPIPTPKVFDNINECAVITLFPMGVDCSVVHPSENGTDGIASLIITGGTPPYSIFWDNGNIAPVIYNLTAGSYEATVIDSYGDFTARTTCVLTGSTPSPSPSVTPTPTSPYIEYTMCMETSLLKGDVYSVTQTTFYPDGLFNTRPSWINGAGTKKIIWDTSVTPNRWLLSASTPTVYIITNSNPIYPPTYGGWFVIGGGSASSVIVFSGECNNEPITQSKKTLVLDEFIPFTVNVSKNQTVCGCDGSLTLLVNGGTPPYLYSINSGLTYKTFPIFSDLCSGIYSVKVVDNLGNEVVTTTNLELPQSPKIYTVSLRTTNSTTSIGSLAKSIQYNTKVNVFPELPDGVSITFDISHTNVSRTSPSMSSSTVSTNSMLEIDSFEVTPSNIFTGSSSTLSTLAGCQLNTVFIDSTTEIWTGITIDNQTDLELITETSIFKNEDNNCYIGLSDETYQIINVSISGCNCCKVITS